LGEAIALFNRITSVFPASSWLFTLKHFHESAYHLDYLDRTLVGQEVVLSLSHDTSRTVQIDHARRNRYSQRIESLLGKIEGRRSLAISLGKAGVAITHGDLKITNAIFRRERGVLRCIALIDLDTIQPGGAFDDIGDALRSAGNPAGEEPVDVNAVMIDERVVNNIIDGYVSKTEELFGTLQSQQLKGNAEEAFKLFLYMQHIRFLADFLVGDRYFRLKPDAREDLNLYRAEVQMRALEKLDEFCQGQAAHQVWFQRFTQSVKHRLQEITVSPVGKLWLHCDVFDPRHATSRYLIAVLKQNSFIRPGMKVLVLGCGSGSDTLFAVFQGAKVDAVDIEYAAIANTQINLEAHGLLGRARVFINDGLNSLGRYDAILWNCPEALSNEVVCSFPRECFIHERDFEHVVLSLKSHLSEKGYGYFRLFDYPYYRLLFRKAGVQAVEYHHAALDKETKLDDRSIVFQLGASSPARRSGHRKKKDGSIQRKETMRMNQKIIPSQLQAAAVPPGMRQVTGAIMEIIAVTNPRARLSQLSLLFNQYPDNPRVSVELARLHGELGEFTEARDWAMLTIQQSQRFADRYPDFVAKTNIVAYSVLCRAELHYGNVGSARECVAQMLRLKEDELFALSHLIEILLSEHKLSEAIGVADKALEFDPDSLIVLGQKAKTLIQLGDLKQALAVAEKMLRIDQDSPAAIDLSIAIFFKLQDVGQAVVFARRLTQIEPKNPHAWTTLAKAYRAQNDWQNALMANDYALMLNPGYPEALIQKDEIADKQAPGAESQVSSSVSDDQPQDHAQPRVRWMRSWSVADKDRAYIDYLWERLLCVHSGQSLMTPQEGMHLIANLLEQDFKITMNLDERLDCNSIVDRRSIMERMLGPAAVELPARPSVYLSPYLVLLGCFVKDAGYSLLRIYDASIGKRPEEQISIVGKYSISEAVDACVHYHPLEFVFQGPEAIYAPEFSFSHPEEETHVPMSDDEEAMEKVRHALSLIKERAYSDRRDQDTLRIRAVWNAVSLRMSILLVRGLEVMYANPNDMLVRPFHAGRRRQAIYLPDGFLACFDRESDDDMGELAEYIYYVMYWLDTYWRNKDASHPTELRILLDSLSVAFTKQNGRLGFVDAAAIRSRMHSLLRDATVNMSEMISGIMFAYRQMTQEFELLFSQQEAFSEDSVAYDERRESIYQLRKKLLVTAFRCELLGAERMAEACYERGHAIVKLIQRYEFGAMPIYLQQRMVTFYLKRGRLQQFLEELHVLLTGEGYPRKSETVQSETDRKIQVWLMGNFVTHSMPLATLLEEIDYSLQYLSTIVQEPGFHEEVERVYAAAKAMIEAFQVRVQLNSIPPLVPPGTISSPVDGENRNSPSISALIEHIEIIRRDEPHLWHDFAALAQALENACSARIIRQAGRKILLRTDDGLFFIKVNDEPDFAFEKELVSYEGGFNPFPTPKLLYYNTECRLYIFENFDAVSLFDYLQTPGLKAGQLHEVMREYARALARVHAKQPPDARQRIYQDQSFTARFQRIITRRHGLLSGGYHEVPEMELFSDAEACVLDTENVLNHGDPSPWNLFIDPWSGEIIAFIDWEAASLGARSKDLAKVVISLIDARKNNAFLIDHLKDMLLVFFDEYCAVSGIPAQVIDSSLPYYLGTQLLWYAEGTQRTFTQNPAWVNWRIELCRWALLQAECGFDIERLDKLLNEEISPDCIAWAGNLRVHTYPHFGYVSGRQIGIELDEELDFFINIWPNRRMRVLSLGNIAIEFITDVDDPGVWHSVVPVEFFGFEGSDAFFKCAVRASLASGWNTPFGLTARYSTELSSSGERIWKYIEIPYGNCWLEVRPGSLSAQERASWEESLLQSYAALMFDFDGTFKPYHEKKPPISIYESVARKLASGIHCAPNSGRGTVEAKEVERFFEELGKVAKRIGVASDIDWKKCHVYLEAGATGYNLDTRQVYYRIVLNEDSRRAVAQVLGNRKFNRFIDAYHEQESRTTFIFTGGVDRELFALKLNLQLETINPGLEQPVIGVYTENYFEIGPLEATKRAPVLDLSKRIDLPQHRIGRIGDQGQRFGADRPMLDSLGGFSVFFTDRNLIYPVSTVRMASVRNVHGTQWLLDNLHFGASSPVRMKRYQWNKSEIEDVENVLDALSSYRPDMVRNFDYLRKDQLSPEGIEHLRENIYGLDSNDLKRCGLNAALDERSAPRFKGRAINVVLAAFNDPRLGLFEEGFERVKGVKAAAAKERKAKAKIRNAIRSDWPRIIQLYEMISSLDEHEKEYLRILFYGITSDYFKQRGLGSFLNETYIPAFKGSFIVAMQRTFPLAGLDSLGFELDWTTKDRGCASVRFVLSRRRPDIMRSYADLDSLSDLEITVLREKLYSIRSDHFKSKRWGLAGALDRRVAPYFEGRLSCALCTVFDHPRLGLTEQGFREFRRKHHVKRFHWADVHEATENVREGLRSYDPGIMERYDRLDSLSFLRLESLLDDIYSLGAGEFGLAGIGGFSLCPDFEGSIIIALQKSLPKLTLDPERFRKAQNLIKRRHAGPASSPVMFPFMKLTLPQDGENWLMNYFDLFEQGVRSFVVSEVLFNKKKDRLVFFAIDEAYLISPGVKIYERIWLEPIGKRQWRYHSGSASEPALFDVSVSGQEVAITFTKAFRKYLLRERQERIFTIEFFNSLHRASSPISSMGETLDSKAKPLPQSIGRVSLGGSSPALLSPSQGSVLDLGVLLGSSQHAFGRDEPVLSGRTPRERSMIDASLQVAHSLRQSLCLTYIVPMYEEEKRLRPWSSNNQEGEFAIPRKVLQLQALKHANPSLLHWRLIVVDDGSRTSASLDEVNRSWELLRASRFGRRLRSWQLTLLQISHEEKITLQSKKGYPIRLGMRHALDNHPVVSIKHEFIGFTDVDRSTNLLLSGNLFAPLLAGDADLAVGSRWVQGAQAVRVPWAGQFSSKAFNEAVHVLLPLLRSLSDTQRGFKLATPAALTEIVQHSQHNGLAIDVELLLLAKILGFRIAEVPICWVDSRKASKVIAHKEAKEMLFALLEFRRRMKAWPTLSSSPAQNFSYSPEFNELIDQLSEYDKQDTFARASHYNAGKYPEDSLEFLLFCASVYFRDTPLQDLITAQVFISRKMKQGRLTKAQAQEINEEIEIVHMMIRSFHQLMDPEGVQEKGAEEAKRSIDAVLNLRDDHEQLAAHFQERMYAIAPQEMIFFDIAGYFKDRTEAFFRQLAIRYHASSPAQTIPQSRDTHYLKAKPLPQSIGRVSPHSSSPVSARPKIEKAWQVHAGALLVQNRWSSLASLDAIDEVHVITAGGGGDILGAAFLAREIQLLANKPGLQMLLITTNLKRGEENPKGGPTPIKSLRLQNHSLESMPIQQLGNAKYFYKLDSPRIKARFTLDGFETEEVTIKEGSIVEPLKRWNISLAIMDLDAGCAKLAENYAKLCKGKRVLTIGLDMGGDIFARYPSPITEDNKYHHPEINVRSPVTDSVVLGMLCRLREKGNGNVVLGVSASGGDGELGLALSGYLRDYFNEGQIAGLLDNVALLQSDSRGLEVLEDVLALDISSEVSLNFLRRIMRQVRGPSYLSGRGERKEIIEGWENLTLPNLSEPAELFSLAEELPIPLSRQHIRNKTRTEILPALYLYTAFFDPLAVQGRIEPRVWQALCAHDTWRGQERYFRERLHYITELNDPNNIASRKAAYEFYQGIRARFQSRVYDAAGLSAGQAAIAGYFNDSDAKQACLEYNAQLSQVFKASREDHLIYRYLIMYVFPEIASHSCGNWQDYRVYCEALVEFI
ncbi:MAG: phosphotransferase, partial [Candidatus Omnitrophica bacterium]|nr:phosphotransferase [Candidatus Omnitrophota bacterium]